MIVFQLEDEDNTEACVQLAEAVGWHKNECGHWTDGSPKTFASLPFNPFEDANDDYAVLEWAWWQLQCEIWNNQQWETFKDYWREDRVDWNVWNYTRGQFARAALKVIND